MGVVSQAVEKTALSADGDRRALDEIAARQCAADEKRKKEAAQKRQEKAVISQSGAVIQ